jgi:hypothetical protein
VARKIKDPNKKIIEAMPTEKDPMWPEGAVPMHLSKEELENKDIIDAYVAIKGDVWKCRKCGSDVHQSKRDTTLCESCEKSQAQNSTIAIKTNSNWIDQAGELGLALFERQPEETDLEWRIWCAYREYYPMKLPTQSELAAKVGCSVAPVTKAIQRWSFKVRLIAWARFTDADIQEARIAAIREMNKTQLTTAQTMQEKLRMAVDALDPLILRPNEIVSMMKLATELETRITSYKEEAVESTAADSQSHDSAVTKPEDMSEIIAILQKSGMLNNKQLGIETTTRVIVKEED